MCVSGSALLFSALDLLLKVTTVITADVYTGDIPTAATTTTANADLNLDPEELMRQMLAVVQPKGGRQQTSPSSSSSADSGDDSRLSAQAPSTQPSSTSAVLSSVHSRGVHGPAKEEGQGQGQGQDGSWPSVALSAQWRADLLQRIVEHLPLAYRCATRHDTTLVAYYYRLPRMCIV